MSLDLQPSPTGSDTPLQPILMNILTIFFLVLSCLCPIGAVAIFIAPESAINPLPPRTPMPTGPTPTNTSIYSFPATWTQTPTREITSTRTPRPTAVPETQAPSLTPFPLSTAENGSTFPFIQEGSSADYTASLKGCAKLYVGGYVYDNTRAPINNLLVHLKGAINSFDIDLVHISGSDPDYKDGGFEFTIDNPPTLTIQKLSLQLLDANQTPLSDPITFNTYEGCDKNLVLVNFILRSN
jgi:hypothetical protein